MGINSIYEILCSIIYRKMNKIAKVISIYTKIGSLQSFHTARYPSRQLLSPFYFHFSQDNNKIQQTIKLGAHSQYTQNLKDFKWVNDRLHRIQYLLGYTNNTNLNYTHLRSVINQLLSLCRHITNARPYHSSLTFDIQKALNLISKMVRLTFSEMSNQTHESIDQEGQNTYQFIQFSAYFQICDTWNTSPDRQVLSFYLNSYMNLLFDRNFLKYITVFDVLRQGWQCDTRKQIINRSVKGINDIVHVLKQKMDKVDLLNPYQMAIYLKFLRNNLYAQKPESEKEKDLRILTIYILNSPKELDQSLAHCENLTYSIYFLFTLQEMKGSYIFLVFQWITERMRTMMAHNRQDYFLQYLMGFTSHEDKLTCLKIDIWLDLLDYQQHQQIDNFNIRPHVQSLLLSIHELSFEYWRCKYFFWLMDSLLSKYPTNCLPLIKKICAYLPKISFRKNDKINSAVIFLLQITKKYQNLSDISDIHVLMASWLCKIPTDSLKNQKPSDLCDILTLADKHPSLQQIYSPYLAVLLQLSLGHFPWTQLNRIYYYGLRFGVEEYSQEAQWNMEYVRRYILNQYATMGIIRRQIPEDSYFYKIIGITTPQKFYKNYLKNE